MCAACHLWNKNNHKDLICFKLVLKGKLCSRACSRCDASDPQNTAMISTALKWVVLVVFIILTIVGNVLVCLAVGTSRRLHRIANCFIVSLAVTDLLLGLLVLPFSATLELRDGHWPLGGALCNIYISMDVMLCTASILTLLAISVDRYLAISGPLRYPRRVTPRRVAAAIAAIWMSSLAVSFVPIHLGWNTWNFSVQHADWMMHEEKEKWTCRYEWHNSYVILDSFVTFYLPLLVMCGMYHRIFCVAREQVSLTMIVKCDALVLSHACCQIQNQLFLSLLLFV